MTGTYIYVLALCQLLTAAVDLPETSRSIFMDAYSIEGRLSPSFHNGKLISAVFETAVAGTANVFVYAKSGAPVASYALSPAGAIKIRIWDAAIGSSGTVAATGQAVDREGRQTMFLAIVPPGKTQSAIHRLNPYTGERVAVASDGSVWLTTGRTDEGGGDEAANGDYKVLRHFSADGKLLGEFVPRSSLQGVAPASGSGGTNLTWLRATGERVGAYFGNSHRWLELEGGKVARECQAEPPLRAGEPPISLGGLALPASGGPVALFHYPTPTGTGIFQLDCGQSVWQPLASYSSTDVAAVTDLVGIDGDQLGVRGPRASMATILWVQKAGSAK